MKRLGLIAPDPADARDRRVRLTRGDHAATEDHALRVGTSIGDVSLEHHAGPVLNQLNTSSCVAHAFVEAELVTRRALLGEDPEIGSRLFLYYLARVKHERPVRDEGTYCRTAAKALTQYGILPESLEPFDPELVNRQPSIDLVAGAHPRRKAYGYFRLDGEGQILVERALAALHSRRAFVIGIECDEAFTDDAGDGVIGPRAGAGIGGHAIAVIGARFVDERWLFRIQNSWGSSWREKGRAWLEEWWLHNSWDRWIIDPRPVSS